MGKNGTERVARQEHKLAQILKKREQWRAQSAKEADHYGSGDQSISERLMRGLRNILF